MVIVRKTQKELNHKEDPGGEWGNFGLVPEKRIKKQIKSKPQESVCCSDIYVPVSIIFFLLLLVFCNFFSFFLQNSCTEQTQNRIKKNRESNFKGSKNMRS